MLYRQHDAWSLVVRNFFVNPSGEYVDVQRHDPDDCGYAFQMCRVDEAEFGSFCEMEYHAPGLGGFARSRPQRGRLAGLGLSRPAGDDRTHRPPTVGDRMMSLSMLNADVPGGSLALWWLGQAGFAFKTAAGRIVYLDPYLSDAVERLHGFKRLSLPPLAAEEVRADLVVLTHEHADHLDPDALPIIARNNPVVPVCGARGLHCRG